MKAAYINQTGDAKVIHVGDLPEPNCGPDQVLIRVYATSINPIDTYVRSGAVAFELPQPYILGCDAAGVIEKRGENVSELNVGDRVWCTNQGLLGVQGTTAERISVAAHWCYKIPDNCSFEEAAANALVGVTAHLGLFRSANLQAGETVFVIGGSGGVGSMVVQMAVATGARVITTAGTEQKCQNAISLGAETAINYREKSILEELQKTSPEGVNVFWETRREPDFDLAVQALAERGRMILMAGRDARPVFPVGPFYVKECTVSGFVMFKATPEEMRESADQINHWMASGQLKANIGATFTIDQIIEAHELQEQATLHQSADLSGKIIIKLP